MGMTIKKETWLPVLLATIIVGAAGCSADGSNEDLDSESDIETLPGTCSYETGEYVNYFEKLDISPDEVTEKIDAVWQQYTEGDPDDEALYFEAGENDDGPLAYIMDIANNDIRSEGMSYGMMFAVELDHQDQFDALWNFAKTHMWHGEETHPFYENFSWHVRPDGSAHSEGPAPDGEEYFAMALYFASGRWGDGDGIYDYRAEADRITSAMKNRERISGTYNQNGRASQATGVAMFNPDYKMVRFSPNEGYFLSASDHTDPSYHLPAFYQLWSVFGPEADRDFWAEAADAGRDFFQAAANPDTGLTPDYATFEGEPVPGYNNDHGYFAYDAQRTVMNWSVDWAWWCTDERERTLSDTLQAFFDDQGPGYLTLFDLDGTPKEPNHTSTGLKAMNAVSALSAQDEELSKEFVSLLWQLVPPVGEYRYYDGMLYLFAMLHVSGNFHIFEPEM